ATTLGRQGKGSQALARFERATLSDPDHTETLFELSGLYAQMDRLADATDLAERLARRPGWAARASARLGLLFDDQNEPARAAEALESALRLDPELSGAALGPAVARSPLARPLLN